MGFNMAFGMGLTQDEFGLLQVQTQNKEIRTNPGLISKNNDKIDLDQNHEMIM